MAAAAVNAVRRVMTSRLFFLFAVIPCKGMLHLRQVKTGTELSIPVLPALEVVIASTPKEHLTFLTTAFGKPFTAAGFGNWFREKCNAASLPHCSAHGLRKAA